MEKIKLFCFHHLGGNASFYYKWKNFLPNNIELFPIDLAGRGMNKKDFYRNFKELINDVGEQLKKEITGPYILFGHSMGALIVYELIYYLKQQKLLPPLHCFFSGRNTPDLKSDIFYENFDKEKFILNLRKIGGIPAIFELYPELLEEFIPIIKADYNVMKSYEFITHKDKIDSDISILIGKEDNTILYEELAKWRCITRKNCDLYFISGNHFYLFDDKNISKIINILTSKIQEN